VFRDDVRCDALPREQALANAPSGALGFLVPPFGVNIPRRIPGDAVIPPRLRVRPKAPIDDR